MAEREGTTAQPAAHAPSIGAGRLSALDGIRALAIIMVIAFHTTSISRFPLDRLGVLAMPVVHGWMGVDLFFGMSGFLITRLWLEEEEAAPSETAGSRARRFFARRSLRILPLYYITLGGFLLLARFVHLRSLMPFARSVAADPWALGSYLLFFVNYVSFGRDGAFALRWSLCVEEHFYLLWPCVLLLARTRRHRVAVAALAIVAVLAARSFAIVFGDHRQGWATFMMVRYSSHLRIDAILMGCLAALVYDTLVSAPRARRVFLAASIAVVGLFVAVGEMTVMRAPTPIGGGVGSSLIAASAALLAAEVTAAPRSWLARLLAVRPLPMIGSHSYAMYLVHPLAIDIAVGIVLHPVSAPTIGHWALTVALTVALALLAAVVLHWTVEQPFRRLRARFRLVRPAE